MQLPNKVFSVIRVMFPFASLLHSPTPSWFPSHDYQEENLASFSDVYLPNFSELPVFTPGNCGQKDMRNLEGKVSSSATTLNGRVSFLPVNLARKQHCKSKNNSANTALIGYFPGLVDIETNWAWIKQSKSILNSLFTLKTNKTVHLATYIKKHLFFPLITFECSTCLQFL